MAKLPARGPAFYGGLWELASFLCEHRDLLAFTNDWRKDLEARIERINEQTLTQTVWILPIIYGDKYAILEDPSKLESIKFYEELKNSMWNDTTQRNLGDSRTRSQIRTWAHDWIVWMIFQIENIDEKRRKREMDQSPLCESYQTILTLLLLLRLLLLTRVFASPRGMTRLGIAHARPRSGGGKVSLALLVIYGDAWMFYTPGDSNNETWSWDANDSGLFPLGEDFNFDFDSGDGSYLPQDYAMPSAPFDTSSAYSVLPGDQQMNSHYPLDFNSIANLYGSNGASEDYGSGGNLESPWSSRLTGTTLAAPPATTASEAQPASASVASPRHFVPIMPAQYASPSPHGAPSSNSWACNEPGCGKSFMTEPRLRAHQKRHERGYECRMCDRRFGARRDLQRHESSVHADSAPFKCNREDCRRSTRGFPRLDNLQRHIRDCHEKKEEEEKRNKKKEEGKSKSEEEEEGEEEVNLAPNLTRSPRSGLGPSTEPPRKKQRLGERGVPISGAQDGDGGDIIDGLSQRVRKLEAQIDELRKQNAEEKKRHDEEIHGMRESQTKTVQDCHKLMRDMLQTFKSAQESRRGRDEDKG
ncbi:hypothetical protein F4778DRAFT_737861 [Xylariomycetidae sp. FL2044]|nr:hypothetical protein F4778DRAFT_737861 [Xylariomycetidae sp. FL2044]